MSSRIWWTIGLLLAVAGCGPREVALRPAKTCDGGNLDACRQGCDQNEGRACYRLGWFYDEGQGVDQSKKRAIDLYDRACAANFAVACRALGNLYFTGDDDVKRDRKRGVAYLQKACGLGLGEACPTADMLAKAEGRSKKGAGPSGSASFGVSAGAEADSGGGK
jgi:TPR repeat protein